jgi:hypothetical protein
MPYEADKDVKQPSRREYEAAKCETPHDDGSACHPEWDGRGYVCIYRLMIDLGKAWRAGEL